MIPTAERVDVSGSDSAYWQLVAALWATGESFLLVEHDIEPTPKALRQARHCACWWSVSPYRGPNGDLLEGSLGFTRFRAQLLRAEPDLPHRACGNRDGTVERNWRCLDTRLLGELWARGYRPHVHMPAVTQHHYYRGECTCGADHDYPVDVEGRYQPN